MPTQRFILYLNLWNERDKRGKMKRENKIKKKESGGPFCIEKGQGLQSLTQALNK